MGLQTYKQTPLFQRTLPKLLPSKVLQREKRTEAAERLDEPKFAVTKNWFEAVGSR